MWAWFRTMLVSGCLFLAGCEWAAAAREWGQANPEAATVIANTPRLVTGEPWGSLIAAVLASILGAGGVGVAAGKSAAKKAVDGACRRLEVAEGRIRVLEKGKDGG